VLTVKSITDWNVRLAAKQVLLAGPLGDLLLQRWVKHDWRAPLIGKELYLNGIELGSTLGPAALASREERRQAGRPTKRAKL
jgi:hypothetical protein